MFGQSIRKCGCPSPVQRGTFPVSTASKLTSQSGRNGTARTRLRFYLLSPSSLNRRRTASITHRNRRSRFVGNRLIQNISAPLPCVAATPKHFMLRPYRRFHRFHTGLPKWLRSIDKPELFLRDTRYRKSQPKAGGGLRMVLRGRLQPEMDQGPHAQRGLVAY